MDWEIIHIPDQPAAGISVNQEEPSEHSEEPETSQMKGMQDGQSEEVASIPISKGENQGRVPEEPQIHVDPEEEYNEQSQEVPEAIAVTEDVEDISMQHEEGPDRNPDQSQNPSDQMKEGNEMAQEPREIQKK